MADVKPAVLTLRIDTSAAKRELEQMERERKETGRGGAPVEPGARRESESAGEPGSEAQRSRAAGRPERDYDPAQGGRRVFNFARGAVTGDLAGQVDQLVQGAAATIPGGGAAYRAGRISARYGPMVAAAVAELLPEGMAPVGAAMTNAASGVAKAVTRAESALSAFDQTMQDLRPVARLQERHGSVDRESLGKMAMSLYTVNRTREVWARDRSQVGEEALGAAMAKLLTQRGAVE